jgi:Ca-activated chloride channel family protein
MRRASTFFLLFVGSIALQALSARGQGVLVNINAGEQVPLPRPAWIIYPPYPIPRPIPHPIVPPPPATYKIKDLSIQAKVVEQVAKVQVSQSFVNTGSRQMEVSFIFPLPYDGAVDQLTLLIDGKEFPAKLLAAKEARRVYEDIVRKNRDPALLEWMGTGMFQTSVFPVPPGAERKVTLRYTQLCRKADGLTDFLFPLSTAKYTTHPVEQVSVEVSIESQQEIKNVYSPTHSIEIKRPDNKHAQVSYVRKNEVPGSDFRLFWDVGKGPVGATVLSYRPSDKEDGYFLLLASPEITAPDASRPRKTVIFAVDRSGSMSGEKIEQAKAALKFVLNNLRDGDLFNIIAYDSEIESFRPELQKFNDETRQAALGFVSGIYAGGSTNIDGALKTALSQLKDANQPSFVLFLTDGIPTTGETNEAKIVANARAENSTRARIFAFGVGYDLNSRLLDKLVRENFGLSEFVRPHEDIEARVAALYSRIGAPVMTDMNLQFSLEGVTAADGQPVNRVYPKKVYDLFAGEQLMVVGRYQKSGAAKVSVSGSISGKEQKFDFPAQLVEHSSDESQAFIEKLWAMRRVGEILDEIDLKGRNEELVKELVTLATKHGILTPYTAFLADEETNLRDASKNLSTVTQNLGELSKAEGREGVAQRAMKGALQRAGDLSLRSNPMGAAPGEAAGAMGGRSVSSPAQAYVDSKDKVVAVDSLKQVGRKTFYRRADRWVDSTLTEEQEKNVVHVERFSRAFFDLVAKHGKDVGQYLAIDEPVVIEIDGQAYSF